MVEEFGIELLQMMENAGRNLAALARRRFLDGDAAGRRVVVLAGSGGNGGGGMVAARHLHNWGAETEVLTTRAQEAYRGVPAHQHKTLRQLGLRVEGVEQSSGLPEADLLLDAVIGYSLSGSPEGPAATLIRWANQHDAPVLSLDLPSGLDGTSGEVRDPTVRATATMTLALPKTGLFSETAKPVVGELYLADIGVPPSLYRGPGLELEVGAIFGEAEVVRVG